MPASIDQVRGKVQRILTQRFHVGLDSDGDFTIAYESAQVWIRILALDDEQRTMVRLEAPLLFGVQESPELFKYIATHTDECDFGHLSLQERADGYLVLFVHTLLGDFLDEDELLTAVDSVLEFGNALDDQLQQMFGGQRFCDE